MIAQRCESCQTEIRRSFFDVYLKPEPKFRLQPVSRSRFLILSLALPSPSLAQTQILALFCRLFYHLYLFIYFCPIFTSRIWTVRWWTLSVPLGCNFLVMQFMYSTILILYTVFLFFIYKSFYSIKKNTLNTILLLLEDCNFPTAGQ